jgi:hypothetical protein
LEDAARPLDDSDQRQITRDSLFVMADLRLDGSEDEHRIKVRNLSAGGMMGEGSVRVSRGAVVWVEIRNIGWVEGSVAWVQDSRFGIAFREEIDPKVARVPLTDGDHTPRHIKTALSQLDRGIVRKV